MKLDGLVLTRYWLFVLSMVFILLSPTWIYPCKAVAEKKEYNLVSNIFIDTDLRQALQDVAAQSGAIIIPGPEITGVVTAELKDKSVESALEIVLSGTDYEWTKKNDYYMIYSPDPNSPIFKNISTTKVINLQFVKAQQVVNLLPVIYKPFVTVDPESDCVMVNATRKMMIKICSALERIDKPARMVIPNSKSIDFVKASQTRLVRLNFITPKTAAQLMPAIYREYVSSGEESNLMVINAVPELLDKIVSIIKCVDQPPKQILLDARIVVLKHSDLLNLGIEWGFPTGYAGTNFLTGEWTDAIQIGLTTGIDFTDSLNAALNLLQQKDKASLIASPQVVAQDGKTAAIKVVTEEYFKVTTGINLENVDLEKIESGTILTIKPKIAEDRTINIELSAEVSDVVSRDEEDLPVINRRTANSTVRIKDGGTIAIAGLMEGYSRQLDDNVPGLSDLPLIGLPFKKRNRLEQNDQVAIFITARLIPENTECPSKEKLPRAPIPLLDENQFKEELRSSYQRLLK